MTRLCDSEKIFLLLPLLQRKVGISQAKHRLFGVGYCGKMERFKFNPQVDGGDVPQERFPMNLTEVQWMRII